MALPSPGIGLAVLLLLDGEDVGGALVAREQVLAVLGREELAERLDALHDEDEIVLAEREHGVDQVVARALFAEVDFEAVGEEGEEVCRRKSLASLRVDESPG